MDQESQLYRLAKTESYHITLSRLEEQFRDRGVSLEGLEQAVGDQLAREELCAPWRTSKTERAGCREGMRLAALEFLHGYREAMQLVIPHGCVLPPRRPV